MKWITSKGLILTAVMLLFAFGSAMAEDSVTVKLVYEKPTWVWTTEGDCPDTAVCDSVFKVEVWGKNNVALNAISLGFRAATVDDSSANFVKIDTIYYESLVGEGQTPIDQTSWRNDSDSTAITGGDIWTFGFLAMIAQINFPTVPIIPVSEDYVKWATIECIFEEDSLSKIYTEGNSGGDSALTFFLDSTIIGLGGKFVVTNASGTSVKPDSGLVFINDTVMFQYSKVDEINPGVIPSNFELSQNYPNPFNPDTKIEFAIPAHSHVYLNVYNTLGQKVTTLVDEELDAGWKSVTWNGRDDSGNQVATGVYLYRLETDDIVVSKKMMLLK